MRVVLIARIVPAVIRALYRSCGRTATNRSRSFWPEMAPNATEGSTICSARSRRPRRPHGPASRDRIAPLAPHARAGCRVLRRVSLEDPCGCARRADAGIVNGHPSLLPRYRGPNPVAWAIRNGEPEIGFTFHYMDAELDTGDDPRTGPDPARRRARLGGVELRSSSGSSARSSRLSSSGLKRGDPGDPQSEEGASYFSFFEPEYAWIDWSEAGRRDRAPGPRVAVPLAATPTAAHLTELGRSDCPGSPREPRAG